MQSAPPSDINEQLNQAIRLHQIGQLEGARQAYLLVLQTQPENAVANHNFGVLLRQSGADAAALPHLRKARDVAVKVEQYHLSHADALMDCQLVNDAIEALEHARQCGFESLALRQRLARARTLAIDLDSIADLTAPHECERMFALLRAERFVELEQDLQAWLVSFPENGYLWKLLSVTQKRQGKDATLALARAASLRPHDVDAQRNLVRSLTTQNQVQEAHDTLIRMLAGPGAEAIDHVALADILRGMGKLTDAAEAYRHALALDPEQIAAHNNLGNILKDLGRNKEAESCFRSALQINPRSAETWCNLGIVLKATMRNAEAEAACNTALQCNPTLLGGLVLAADFAIDNGKFAEAEQLLQKALTIDAHLPEAWAGIPRTRKMTKSDKSWADHATALADSGLPPNREVFLRYALGKYFDDVKEFDVAFEHFQRANELSKTATRGRGLPAFDADLHRKHVDRLFKTFDRHLIEQARTPNTSKRPVFIVGMPRSGTSLAEQILASHPAAFGAGELSFWNNRAQSYFALGPDVAKRDQLLDQLATLYQTRIHQFSHDAERVIDKMPDNFLHLGLIHLVFPAARIIHMRRNPIDVCLSIYFNSFSRTHLYTSDLNDLVNYYRDYERLMAHWHATLPPGVMLDVCYEELVADPEYWSRSMLSFIDLPWDERCLNFHQSERVVRTPSNWQVRQSITKASVERWRNYEKFIGPLAQLKSDE